MFNLNRKGQITVFIILGILIVLVFSLFFILKQTSVSKNVKVTEEVLTPLQGDNIKLFVESCLNRVSEEGLVLIGRQGGYYQSPLDYSILFVGDKLPYYYYEDEIRVLEIEDAEKELERYIKDYLPVCVDNFKIFEKSGYDITEGEIVVSVSYNERTKIVLNYPLKFELGQDVMEFDTFIKVVNVNVKKFIEAAEELVEQNLEDKGYICLTCMEDTAASKNILIDALPIHDSSVFANDIIMFRLEDKKPVILDYKNFTFEFIMEYLEVEIEEKLEIEDLGTFEIGVGELFEKTIVSNKEDVSYTDDSELFEISANGKISFTANKMDKGTHFVIITAETTAEKDNEFVIFKVTG